MSVTDAGNIVPRRSSAQPNRLNVLYRLALGLFGLMFSIEMCLFSHAVLTEAGAYDVPTENLATISSMFVLSVLPLLILTGNRSLPSGVRMPSKWLHLPMVIVVALAVTNLLTFILGMRSGTVGLEKEVIYAISDANPQLEIVTRIVGFVAVVLAVFSILEAIRNDPSPKPLVETFAALRLHRMFLAVTGGTIIISGVSLFLTMGRDAELNAFYAANGLAPFVAASAAICVLFGLSLLFRDTMPGFVHRPLRWLHFPGIAIYLIGVSLAALAVTLVPMTLAVGNAASGQAAGTFLTLDPLRVPQLVEMVSAVASLALIPTTILVIRRPRPLSPAQQEALARGDMPEGSRKDLRKAKLPEPKLPSIGAAMKMYVAADWMVMRLLGLGLLGTAYILWGLIEGGRDYQAVQISYGFPPLNALVAYSIAGGLMTIPFLLPRFITAPRSVLGGLVKAVVLVATALVLLPMVHVAIDLYTPEPYWPTLHAVVPNLFKAVAAVAVTSALLISFFRQLGMTPKVDYAGRPVVELSTEELRALRQARFEQNSL